MIRKMSPSFWWATAWLRSGADPAVLRAISSRPADRRVEQAPAERAGRRGLRQLLLDVVDELFREALRAEVPLLDGRIRAYDVGCVLGHLGRAHRRAEPVRCSTGRYRTKRQAAEQDAVRATAAPRQGRRRAHFQAAPRPASAGPGSAGRRGTARRSSASSEAVAYRRRGSFSQALQADRLEVAGRVTLDLAGRSGSWLETCSRVESGVVPLNGGRPVSISYRIAPSGVDVGRRRDLVRQAADLLGRHVAGRAQELADLRQAVVPLQQLGQTEVGDLGDAVLGQAGRWRASGRGGRSRADGR